MTGASIAAPIGSLGRQTAIYAVGIMLSKVLGFFMLPFYTHYLRPADYGVIQLVELTLDMASIVAGARLAAGVFLFYHKAEDEAGRQRVCATAFLLTAAGYAVVAVLVVVFRVPLTAAFIGAPPLQRALLIGSATFVLQGLSLVPYSVMRIRQAAMLFTVMFLGRSVLQAALNIVFLRRGWGVEGALLAGLCATAVFGVASLVWFLRWSRAGFTADATIGRALIRFGAPLMLGQVATFVVTFGDRYFLRALASDADVGLYAFAYQFGFMLVGVAYQPFAQAWESARFEMAKRPDRDAAFSRTFLQINVPLLAGFTAIAVLAPAVIRFMADRAYWSAGILVLPILAAYVVQCWSGMLDLGIFLSEQTRRMAQANYAAAVVAVSGYALLIPRFGGMGAALATFTALTCRTALIHYWSQRLIRIRLRWDPVRRMAAAGLAAGVAGALLPVQPMLIDGALRLGLLGLWAAVAWWWAFSRADRSEVGRVAERLRGQWQFR